MTRSVLRVVAVAPVVVLCLLWTARGDMDTGAFLVAAGVASAPGIWDALRPPLDAPHDRDTDLRTVYPAR